MSFKSHNKLSGEYVKIIKYIISGYSRIEIANKLNFSVSNISYKLKEIYNLFDVNNKHEFVIVLFSRIYRANRKKLEKNEASLNLIKKEIEILNNFLKRIVNAKRNTKQSAFWINKARIYLEKQKITY